MKILLRREKLVSPIEEPSSLTLPSYLTPVCVSRSLVERLWSRVTLRLFPELKLYESLSPMERDWMWLTWRCSKPSPHIFVSKRWYCEKGCFTVNVTSLTYYPKNSSSRRSCTNGCRNRSYVVVVDCHCNTTMPPRTMLWKVRCLHWPWVYFPSSVAVSPEGHNQTDDTQNLRKTRGRGVW